MTADARRFGLDTNVLVYAIEAGGSDRTERAEQIVRRAVASRRCILSLQNIGEFYHVCARKRHAPPDAAARRAADYSRLFEIAAPGLDEVRAALAEAAAGRFSYWDALLLATLGRAGCSVVLSEDMQDGIAFAGAVVRNPFGGDRLPDDVEGLLGTAARG
jgi:predicted nucleic acid-binding protein